jgi:hypothetical protein
MAGRTEEAIGAAMAALVSTAIQKNLKLLRKTLVISTSIDKYLDAGRIPAVTQLVRSL